MIIAICDNEDNHIEDLYQLIQKYDFFEETAINTYSSGHNLIEDIRSGIVYDIIFMDIELDKGENGIVLTKFIKNFNFNTLVIFVSSYDTYFNQIVQAEPFRFIQKPVQEGALFAVLTDACGRILSMTKKLFKYNSHGAEQQVDLNRIQYFYSTHRTINGKLVDGSEVSFYEKLDNIEEKIKQICPQFVRVSKSYFVNSFFIDKAYSNEIYINNERIPMSSKYSNSLLSTIAKFSI